MNEHHPIHHLAREQAILASGLLTLMVPQAEGPGVLVKGLDGRYQLANKTLETLTGRSARDIVGQTDATLFAPEVAARLVQGDQEIIEGAATASVELDFLINGMPLRCLCFKFPVPGPDGQLLAIGAVLLDLSGEAAVEDMLQSLDRLHVANLTLQKNLAELDRLARTDPLTGAWNRRRMEEAAANEIERLLRYDHPVSLLVLALDGRAPPPDAGGSATDDADLKVLAQRLQAGLRATDALARWDAAQWVVLCPNTMQFTAAGLARQLLERTAAAVFPDGTPRTLSIGVAECQSGDTWDAWLQRAEAAFAQARAEGGNQVQSAPQAPQRTERGENVATNFVQLSWHAAYACGNAQIDAQHRALFRDTNQILSALLSGRPEYEVSTLIDRLINDVVQHFQDEEVIITAAGFPGAAEHAAIHRALLEKAAHVANRFHAGTLGIGELFQYLAQDVVAKHMLGADRAFFPYLEAAPADPGATA